MSRSTRRAVLANALTRAPVETQMSVLDAFDNDEVDFDVSQDGRVAVSLTNRGRALSGDVEAIRTVLAFR